MRSKQKKQSSNDSVLPPDSELPFQLGDLVLCRYSTYPYWPATVDETHQKQRSGQHVCMHETRGRQKTLAFWCTFSDEDTGGWVRADRMVLFHPSLLDYVRVRSNHDWYNSQNAAIIAALRAYKTIHRGSTLPPKPEPPTDMLRKRHPLDQLDLLSDDDEPEDNNNDQVHRDNDPMDLGTESSDDERRHRRKSSSSTRGRRRPTTSAKSPRTPAQTKPMRKKRKSTATPKTATPPPRKRAKSAEHHLEDQLLHQSESKQVAALKSRIEEMQASLEKLTASLRRKEKALSDLRTSGNVVTFAPVKQDTVPIETMPQPFTGPLLSSDEFEHRVSAMRQLFEKLDDAAKDVHGKRQELSAEQEKIRQHYGSLLDGVSDAQGKVVEHQKELAELLRGILVNRVAVIDLRKHQAGNLIKTMSKRYKDMPNVSAYCNALYRGWKRQVVDYVHNNPGVKDEERKKDKVPRSEGKENGAVHTPSGSQEDRPKGSDTPKRSKGSDGNGAAEKDGDSAKDDSAKDGKGNGDVDSDVKSEPKAQDKMEVDSAAKKEGSSKEGSAKDGSEDSAEKDAKEEQASDRKKMDVDTGPKKAVKKEKDAQAVKDASEEKKTAPAGNGPDPGQTAAKQPVVAKKKSDEPRSSDKDAKMSEEKEEGSSGKQDEGNCVEKPTPEAKDDKVEGKAAKAEDKKREGDKKGEHGGGAGAVKEAKKVVEAKGEGGSKDGAKMDKKDGAAAGETKKAAAAKKEGAKV